MEKKLSKLTVGGIPIQVEEVEDLHVDGEKLWGCAYHRGVGGIKIEAKAGPERQLRVILHEVLHVIVHEYHVKISKKHMESSMDQLAMGLAEMLESIGITKLPL